MRDGLVNLVVLYRPRIKKGEQLEIQRHTIMERDTRRKDQGHVNILLYPKDSLIRGKKKG